MTGLGMKCPKCGEETQSAEATNKEGVKAAICTNPRCTVVFFSSNGHYWER